LQQTPFQLRQPRRAHRLLDPVPSRHADPSRSRPLAGGWTVPTVRWRPAQSSRRAPWRRSHAPQPIGGRPGPGRSGWWPPGRCCGSSCWLTRSPGRVAAAGLGRPTVTQGDGWPTHFPGLLGPAFAALLVTGGTQGSSGVGELLRRMVRWRIGLLGWLLAASPLGLGAVAAVMVGLAGQARQGRCKPRPSTTCLQSQIGCPRYLPKVERRRSGPPWHCPWLSAGDRSGPL
jgi:hypothetical protein